MKIFVNIALLLILLALLAVAVTVPRNWTERERSATAAATETESLLLPAEEPSPELPPTEEPKAEPYLDPEEPEPEPEPSRATPSNILDIVSKLQRGESDDAALLINEALETLEDRDAIALQSIVSTEASKAEQIHLLTTQLSKTKKELAEVEKSSRKALDESLRTLTIATKRADQATSESQKRTRELEKEIKERSTAAKVSQPKPSLPKKQLKLPDNDLIDFSFGSTYLNESNKETLSKVVTILKERSDIQVQLRGHTDTVGNPEYNAILANARCEMARDFLTDQGIDTQRISIVSFGESQVFKDGVVAEKPRRVEILFRREA